MSLTRRGALFAGKLFAGLLFGPGAADTVLPRVLPRSAGGAARRRVRKILVDQVESLEELVEQVQTLVRDEPKVKSALRQAKKIRPTSVKTNYANAQAWIAYFELVIAAFRDQERAEQALAELEQSLKLLNALLLRREIAEYLQKEQDEDMFMLFMMMGASEWA